MINKFFLLLILQMISLTNLWALSHERDLWEKFFKVPPIDESLLRLEKVSSPLSNEARINILVWNMYKGKNPTWSSDFEKLANESDLLLLQEVSWQDSMKKSFHNVGLNMDMAISFITQKSQEPTGVANAAKSMIQKSKIYRSTYQETLVRTPKMIAASYIELEESQKTLLIVNIHGVNFVATHALGHQLLEVSSLVKEHNGPVVFAGDFNAWSKEKTDLVLNVMKSLNLKEVNFKVDNRKKAFGFPLDYIFYRDLKLVDSISYGDILGSDHTPMRAIFSAL
jgi:endonuclease/exonuclease/phosphatase (EEP) superfamily protein YafD